MIDILKKNGIKSEILFEALTGKNFNQLQALYTIDRAAFDRVLNKAKQDLMNKPPVEIDRKIIEIQTERFLNSGGKIQQLDIQQRADLPANASFRIGEAQL